LAYLYYSAHPHSLAAFQGPTSKEREGGERKEESEGEERRIDIMSYRIVSFIMLLDDLEGFSTHF